MPADIENRRSKPDIDRGIPMTEDKSCLECEKSCLKCEPNRGQRDVGRMCLTEDCSFLAKVCARPMMSAFCDRFPRLNLQHLPCSIIISAHVLPYSRALQRLLTLYKLLSPTLRVQRLVTNASVAWLSIAKLSFDMVSPAASATLFEGCENSRLATAKRQASVGLGRAF